MDKLAGWNGYKVHCAWLFNSQSTTRSSMDQTLVSGVIRKKMSRCMTKQTKWHVRPAKIQISLGIFPVLSESSLCAQWVAKDTRFLHADSEDSGRMPRLIWVFAGRTGHFVGFVVQQLKCRWPRETDKMGIWWLTHICLVDYSILMNWTSPFEILGVSGVCFGFYCTSNRNSCKQTV